MDTILKKEQPEDEMVRIRAQCYDLICMGFMHGNLEMPNNVVPLSEVFNRMDEFSKEVTEEWGLDGSMTGYDVYACKDGFHLLSYMNGEISEDHRKDERPKNSEKVYFVMRDGGGEEPCTVSETQETYAEFAVRDMEKMLGTFDIDMTRRQWRDENLQKENIYFDVYKHYHFVERGYLYSYKDGKKYQRPLTEKEQAEDELVRIEAESLELIVLVSSWSGGLKMPKDVVPLSEAIKTMDAFSKEVTEHWDLNGERVYYRVYACKDDFHLFSYCGGEICSDHRKDERPKSPEKVYFRLIDGGTTPPQELCTDVMEYAEWAERKLAERWAYVMENGDSYSRWDGELKQWVKSRPENLFFDVYGDKEGMDYRYSYKDGKTFIRPWTKKEEQRDLKERTFVKGKTAEAKNTSYDSLPFMKKGR